MKKTASSTIRLINKSYKIKCPENEMDSLQLAAAKLNEQLLIKKKSYKHLDDYHVLLLSALHLSHELITCQNLQEEQRHQLARFISSLEKKITLATDGLSQEALSN